MMNWLKSKVTAWRFRTLIRIIGRHFAPVSAQDIKLAMDNRDAERRHNG